MKRIHLISSPRNLSTALMYSFASRPDTQVVDEPLYAHYLRMSGAEHPARDEVLKTMHSKIDDVLKSYIFAPSVKPVYFIKNMAHHFLGVNPAFILKLQNIFLIRDPKLIIRSFAKLIPQPTLLDIGVEMECKLLDFLLEHDQEIIAIDSADILKDPERALVRLCMALDLSFFPEMLHWEEGGRKEDGIWAKYWYKNLHKSTGFKKAEKEGFELPDHLIPLWKKALPFHKKLKSYALKL